MIHFESIKSAVTPRMAAERYGLPVGQNGMLRCPFHDDHTPSMKLYDDHYHCFGCGAHGDVIDFAARLFDLPVAEAAKLLAADFGIAEEKESLLGKLHRYTAQQNNERLCKSVLRDYLQVLQNWRHTYAPTSPDDVPDERFAEACRMTDAVEYLLETLDEGTDAERAEAVELLLKDDRLEQMQARVRQFMAESDDES